MASLLLFEIKHNFLVSVVNASIGDIMTILWSNRWYRIFATQSFGIYLYEPVIPSGAEEQASGSWDTSDPGSVWVAGSPPVCQSSLLWRSKLGEWEDHLLSQSFLSQSAPFVCFSSLYNERNLKPKYENRNLPSMFTNLACMLALVCHHFLSLLL